MLSLYFGAACVEILFNTQAVTALKSQTRQKIYVQT